MNKQHFYILTGLPYSGKTTLIKEILKNHHEYSVVSVDDIMDERDMWREGHPTMEDWDLAYTEAFDDLKSKLKAGKTVVWDGGCLKFSEREDLRNVASEAGVNCKLIYLNTSREKIMKRRERNSETNERGHLDDESMNKALSMFEEPTVDENPKIYKSDMDINTWLKDNIG